jgi:hypothetical protein
MGIRSTRSIKREDAISRINIMIGLIATKNYREVERQTFEEEGLNLKREVVYLHERWRDGDFEDVQNWTDEMLGDLLDEPFIRFSMFDNYLVDIGKIK